MDFLEIAKNRHTIRKYDPRPVEKEKILKILEAGRMAPTAVNAQPQRILVLNTPSQLEKVREFCSFSYKKKYVDLSSECDDKEHGKINLYYGAPLVFFIAYDESECWHHPESGESSGVTDAVIVATHMLLEAASLGLGSCWISYFDKEKASKLLNLPDSWKSVAMIYAGYPAADAVPNTHLGGHRKPLEETCFFPS